MVGKPGPGLVTLGVFAEQIADGTVDIQEPLGRPRSNAEQRREIAQSYTPKKALAALLEMASDGKIRPQPPANGEPLKIPYAAPGGGSATILNPNALLTRGDQDVAVRSLRVMVDWNAVILADEKARRDAGRYTIEEAAKELADKTGRDIERWRDTLLAEIKQGKLPLRNPRDFNDRLPYAVPREVDFVLMVEQATTSDLNTLLENNPAWGISYRFSSADSPTQARNKKIQGKGSQMVSEFRRVIANRELNPDALPHEMRGNGDSGLRSIVAEALGMSPRDPGFKSFTRHWERAFESGELSWADKPK